MVRSVIRNFLIQKIESEARRHVDSIAQSGSRSVAPKVSGLGLRARELGARNPYCIIVLEH